MRDSYKMNGPLTKVEVEIENDAAEKLFSMEKFSRLTRSEIMNTALKRFISAHKDFLPPHEDGPSSVTSASPAGH